MNWLLLKNSLLVSALTMFFATGFGLITALWLIGLTRNLRFVILSLAIIAIALPPFLVTNCWLDLLGHTGVWRRWLPLNIFSLGGAVWILCLMLWPVTAFAVITAWQRVGPAPLGSDMARAGPRVVRGPVPP